ncbi:unnamed protein product [Closterium sp. Yama58-4]|nr:unnamed protein product [Closterium sp. Yama58-4]
MSSLCTAFFQQLYSGSQRITPDPSFWNMIPPSQIPPDSLSRLSLPFSLVEISKAIAALPKGKTPGPDGLSGELFRSYRTCFTPALHALFQGPHSSLPPSMLQGRTVLIPKKSDATLVDNLRPITLMNTDYKVLAICLANRLQPLLPSLINHSQKTFIKSRRIGDTLNDTLDIFDWATTQSLPLLALTVDIRKAYDMVDRPFLYTCLSHLGLPDPFIHWVKLMHYGTTTRISVNNFCGPPIPVRTGVRQGCPLAPLLFLCVIEVFHRYSSCFLPGFPISRTQRRLMACYADDITFFLNSDEELRVASHALLSFASVSGEHPNWAKCSLIPFNFAPSDITRAGDIPIRLPSEFERILGRFQPPPSPTTRALDDTVGNFLSASKFKSAGRTTRLLTHTVLYNKVEHGGLGAIRPSAQIKALNIQRALRRFSPHPSAPPSTPSRFREEVKCLLELELETFPAFQASQQLEWFDKIQAESAQAAGGVDVSLPPPSVFSTALYVVGLGASAGVCVGRGCGSQGLRASSVQPRRAAVPAVRDSPPRLPAAVAPGAVAGGEAWGVRERDECVCSGAQQAAAAAVAALRKTLKGSDILLAKTYGFTEKAVADLASVGLFKTSACCGGPPPLNGLVQCGTSDTIGGYKVTAMACSRPQDSIFWDRLHPTEAFNRELAKSIFLGGKDSIEPMNLRQLASAAAGEKKDLDNDADSNGDSGDNVDDKSSEVDDDGTLTDSKTESRMRTRSHFKLPEPASPKHPYAKALSLIRAEGEWSKLTSELCKAYLRYHREGKKTREAARDDINWEEGSEDGRYKTGTTWPVKSSQPIQQQGKKTREAARDDINWEEGSEDGRYKTGTTWPVKSSQPCQQQGKKTREAARDDINWEEGSEDGRYKTGTTWSVKSSQPIQQQGKKTREAARDDINWEEGSEDGRYKTGTTWPVKSSQPCQQQGKKTREAARDDINWEEGSEDGRYKTGTTWPVKSSQPCQQQGKKTREAARDDINWEEGSEDGRYKTGTTWPVKSSQPCQQQG